MKKMFALLCVFALLVVGAAQAEEAYLAAYREALENLYNNQTFPDGWRDENPDCDVEYSGFAVFDVDGDGSRELIIDWSGTDTADYRSSVYDYDEATGSLHLEYDGGVAPKFYDNGIIEQPWTHNQGPSKYFWPYGLSQYIPEQDIYEYKGDVATIEKDVVEEDGWDLEFPESADLDGNGVVYGIDDDDWVDDDAYEQWRLSFAGEGSEMRIPYVNLTLKNIQEMR